MKKLDVTLEVIETQELSTAAPVVGKCGTTACCCCCCCA